MKLSENINTYTFVLDNLDLFSDLQKEESIRLPIPDIKNKNTKKKYSSLIYVKKNNKEKIPLVIKNAKEENELMFNAKEYFQLIIEENYYKFPKSFIIPGNLGYQFIPSNIRHQIFKKIVEVSSLLNNNIFPKWPIDISLEILWKILENIFPGCTGLQRFAWPGHKKSAITLTHDVESEKGQLSADKIANLEESEGFRSCWYFSTHTFKIDHSLIKRLHQAGHEIGSHDAYHDMCTAFLNKDKRNKRLKISREYLRNYSPNICGYRSPGLVRTRDLFMDLSKYYTYDSSIPDTEWVPGLRKEGGCLSFFPFFRDGILVLPVTMPQDIILYLHNYSFPKIFELWKLKLSSIHEFGGMAMLITHVEPHLGANTKFLDYYRDFLRYIKNINNIWIALPKDIAKHWLDSFSCYNHS